MQCVFVGPHERLDTQVLLDGFEKQLYLPAVFVDRRDRCSPKIQMIGQQDNLAILGRIPGRNFPEYYIAVLSGVVAGEPDVLISKNVPVFRYIPVGNNLIISILFEAGDEIDAFPGPE